MATYVTATCSECFQDQEVELSPRRNEIVCKSCRHSVPMFEKHELDSIRSQIAGERRKMYIAMMVFGGAVFLFVLYFLASVGEYQAVIADDAGGKNTYDFVERDASSITIDDPTTGAPQKLKYTTLLAAQIEQIKKDNPTFNDELAAKRAGELFIEVVPPEPSGAVEMLFYLSVAAGLASVAFATIASQEQLVCEF
jgi:hypothetical protein